MVDDGFNPKEWITTTQAAELMGYDYAHVRYLLRKGKLQGMKMGRGIGEYCVPDRVGT
ncbi:MAG: helix-turn-helix domain-containing protein [Anaerolineae bacterium]|nr:helix-turn-helix domain-containing protein [Anaerolineae bacterium]